MLCAVQKNLTEPTGGEDGFLCDDGDRFTSRGVEHVGAEARQRQVAVREIIGGVRQREQIDRDAAGTSGNIRRVVDAGGDGREDRVAGGVLGVNDSPLAVSAFAGEMELA